MRVGLPQMLVASFVLHVAVALGLVLPHLHVTAAPDTTASSSASESTTLVLLRSVDTPDLHQPILPSRPASAPVAAQTTPTLPAPKPLVVATKLAATAPPPASLALEMNPNANVRDLPPDPLLSPDPAPHLDDQSGIVFILDISGSMYEPFSGTTRLALARQAIATRIRALKDGTPFALTVYGETAQNSGPLIAASDATRDAAIRFLSREIDCGGGTDLPAGLESASQLGTGSLVVVSDGDLNIAQYVLKAEAARILGPKGHCPALTVIGIYPRPNTEDGRLLESLADEQGGTYRAERFDGTELVTTGPVKPDIAAP